MRWFKLAAITPVTFLLITAMIPNLPLNNRAIAQERFNLSETKTSIQGNWEWVCCQGQYWGNLEISQNTNIITGQFKDTSNGTGGNIKGKIKGNRVEFIRTWDNNKKQYFTLFLSDDGQVLEGTFEGFPGGFGSKFKAIRQ